MQQTCQLVRFMQFCTKGKWHKNAMQNELNSIGYCTNEHHGIVWSLVFYTNIHWISIVSYTGELPALSYAVKAQTSWFPGSRIPTAHVHQCCRFQSYAKSRRLHAVAHEIDKRNLQSVNHIPGIHDNGRVVTSDFNSVLLLIFQLAYLGVLRNNLAFTGFSTKQAKSWLSAFPGAVGWCFTLIWVGPRGEKRRIFFFSGAQYSIFWKILGAQYSVFWKISGATFWTFGGSFF